MKTLVLFALAGFIITAGVFMMYTNQTKQLQLNQSTTVTLYDYMDCVTTTCADVQCGTDDKICTNASEKYQTCFSGYSACQQWYADEYKNLNSDDYLPATYFNCDSKCRPNQSTSGKFWDVYSCQASCADLKIASLKKETPKPVVTATPSSTVTLYDYMDCVTTTCADVQCATDDKICTNASEKYQTCFSGYTACQQWFADEYKNLNSDDYLPSSYFNCDSKCRPNQSTSGKYWDVYSCQASCADLKIAPLKETPRPRPPVLAATNSTNTTNSTSNITLFQYMECVTTTCSNQICAAGDKVCTAASTKYQACFSENSDCQEWFHDEYGNLSSDDKLTPAFYKCDQACRPNQATAGNYFNIYSCQIGCGGINTNTTKVALQGASTTVTLYDYMDCVTTTCADVQCGTDDKICTNASEKYQTCFSGYSACQQWYADEYKNLNSDDYLPATYFNCDSKCRPNQSTSGKFWDVYSCQASCADLKIK